MKFGGTPMIKASNRILDVIKELEGCSLTVYKDTAGLDTIGIGHLITKDSKITVPLPNEQAALDLLAKDITTIERSMNRIVGNIGLPQNQADALLSFSFNVGTEAFSESTLLKKLRKNDVEGASDEFLRWVLSGPAGAKKVTEGLVKRRVVEQGIFISSSAKAAEHAGKLSSKSLKESITIIEGYLYGQAR